MPCGHWLTERLTCVVPELEQLPTMIDHLDSTGADFDDPKCPERLTRRRFHHLRDFLCSRARRRRRPVGTESPSRSVLPDQSKFTTARPMTVPARSWSNPSFTSSNSSSAPMTGWTRP